ncbi:hypothetical protein SBADM41S_07212 [Streptomyces badius]
MRRPSPTGRVADPVTRSPRCRGHRFQARGGDGDVPGARDEPGGARGRAGHGGGARAGGDAAAPARPPGRSRRRARGRGCQAGGDGQAVQVAHQGHQHIAAGGPQPGVAVDHRDLVRQVEGVAQGLDRVVRRVGEGVHGHHERHSALLQSSDDVEADFEPSRVDEDDRAEGTFEEAVPQEPEALLAGGAEQVEDQFLAEADPAEVHGDGGGGLRLHPGVVVHADAGLGHGFFGRQRPDLAHRADHGRLADAEPSDDHDLHRGRGRGGEDVLGAGSGDRVRASEVHASPLREGTGQGEWRGRSARATR